MLACGRDGEIGSHVRATKRTFWCVAERREREGRERGRKGESGPLVAHVGSILKTQNLPSRGGRGEGETIITVCFPRCSASRKLSVTCFIIPIAVRESVEAH